MRKLLRAAVHAPAVSGTAERGQSDPPISSPRQRQVSTTGVVPVLTPREAEVARLLARGLTNKQIGAELVISTGTARVHVDHIMAKLGVHSRGQVAIWATQHDLLT
jgi:DNA-binding NarL/FixJ family response regulator